MMRPAFVYPVALERDPGGKLQVFARDVPELVTSAWSEAEALEMAADALEVALGSYPIADRDFPPASAPLPGEHLVAPPPAAAAKFVVIAAWRAAGIRKTDLAERLGLAETEVRRILDPDRRTKLERLDEAARALGKRIVIGIEDL
ncbi:antitoxin HicB [Pseudoxanthobacter soli DSM 19599]|uniref:Antitoxin HicB n=1 Tax=Pseudoxanthobacter soli DSM 19599 TaxID=1123029 RepID=A0A1M7ZGV6_9HYPH|nr:type II toxin-antitoxin system HicB family antitoxin [Pseudoxanthobacter soli]SHO64131.1 antitoxin HicB [Pseudoxanthobacter soli DSM 19599]